MSHFQICFLCSTVNKILMYQIYLRLFTYVHLDSIQSFLESGFQLIRNGNYSTRSECKIMKANPVHVLVCVNRCQPGWVKSGGQILCLYMTINLILILILSIRMYDIKLTIQSTGCLPLNSCKVFLKCFEILSCSWQNNSGPLISTSILR